MYCIVLYYMIPDVTKVAFITQQYPVHYTVIGPTSYITSNASYITQ